MGLVVEYLFIVKKEEGFCENADSFLIFITVDTTIIHKKKSSYETLTDLSTNLEVQYKIFCEDLQNGGERLFNLKMLCQDVTKIEDFNILARKIKKIALKINPNNTQIHTIQDDIGSQYALKAYPIIHNIENTLRRLISKFMIINVGVETFKNNIHNEISKYKKKKNDNINDYLHDLDFIDLSEVLFKKYRSIETIDFDKILLNLKQNEVLNNETIIKYLPKSNWERYFSEILNIEESLLQKKWEQLYQIRNDVAHNRFLTKGKFDEIISIIDTIKPCLDNAIDNLDKVKISPIDVELIARLIDKNNYNSQPRLMAAAKELNIGVNTLLDFLTKNGYDTSELRPASKITIDMYQSLRNHYIHKKK